MIKNSLYLLARLLITLLIGLYCSRIVLDQLGVVDFGIYNVVGGVVTLLTFLTGALSSSTQRFFSYEIGKGGKRLNTYYSTTVIIFFILAIIVVIFSQTFGVWFINEYVNIPESKIVSAYYVFQVSVLTFVFSFLSAPFNALIFSHEKMKIYSIFGIVNMFARLGLISTISLFTGNKIIYYAFIMLTVEILAFLMPFIYCSVSFPSIKFKLIYKKKIMFKLINYTGWSLFGHLSSVGYNQGVNIVLNLFFGPSINAARGLSAQVNGAMLGFANNVTLAINPQIIKRYSTNQLQSMNKLVLNGSRYSFLVVSAISMPILFNVDFLLKLWLKTPPEFTSIFIKLLIIDSMICSISEPLKTAVQATGKIKFYQLVVGTILLLNVPVSFLCLQYFSSPLAPFAVAIVLSILATNIRLIFTKKYLNFSITVFYKSVISTCVVVTTLSLILNLSLNYIMADSFAQRLVLSMILSTLTIFFFGLTLSERIYLKSKLKLLLKFMEY